MSAADTCVTSSIHQKQKQACPLLQLHKLKTFRVFLRWICCPSSFCFRVFVLISRKARLVSAKSARWQHCRQFFKLQPASSDFLKHTVCVSLYIFMSSVNNRDRFFIYSQNNSSQSECRVFSRFSLWVTSLPTILDLRELESFEFCNHRTVLHRSQCRSRISSRPPWRARPSRASCVAPRTAPRRRSLTRNRRASFSGSILLDG
jgi:hypothetical protein